MKRLLAILFLSGMTLSFNGSGMKTVYICTSKSDKAYHFDANCIVLKKCSNEVATVSLRDAVKVHHRSECVHEMK